MNWNWFEPSSRRLAWGSCFRNGRHEYIPILPDLIWAEYRNLLNSVITVRDKLQELSR